MSRMWGTRTGAPALGFFFRHNPYRARGLCIIGVWHLFKGFFLSVNSFSRWLKGKNMYDILIILAIVLVWFLLQAYILPKFGVST